MGYSQRSKDDRYRRVIAALDTEFTDIPANSAGAEAADGLRAQFAIIESKSGAQAGFYAAGQAGTDEREVARAKLKTYRYKLANTAETVARKKPGFDENYPSPADETDAELIANSRAVAARAVTDEADFTWLALEKTYVLSGAALTDAFEASFKPTDQATVSRSAAVGGKKEARRQAADFFAELDTYIENYYDDQPDKLHAWRVASRVERSAAKRTDDEEEKK